MNTLPNDPQPINSDLHVSTWISHHTYTPANGECRTLITNHMTHEILVLEDDSSRIWHAITSGHLNTFIKECASKDELSYEDIEEFLSDLIEAKLIQHNSHISQTNKPHATPVPYDINTNGDIKDEATTIEAEFSDWCEAHGYMFRSFLEVTYRCNERCVHCFNPGAAHTKTEKVNRKTAELTLEDYKSLIDELYDLGIFHLTLSGGEFFIRKDAFELLRYIRSKSIRFDVFTNGLQLSEKQISELAQCWPATVHISIYSANPALHDNITCVPGSWKKSVNTLERLNKAGIRTKIKCPLTQATVQGYELVRDLAKRVGAIVSFDPMISAGNDGALSPIELNVQSFGELVALAAIKGSPLYVGSPEAGMKNRTISKTSRPCGVGNAGVSITPEGEILACVALPSSIGHIKDKGGATKVWRESKIGGQTKNTVESPVNVLFESKLTKWQNFGYSNTDECGTHERCQWCNRCIGGSVAEQGTAMKPSDTQCFQASAKLKASQHINEGMNKEEIFNIYNIDMGFGKIYQQRSLTSETNQYVSFEAVT